MTFPIHATCRFCGRDLLLRELTNTGSAACPTCGTPLSRDYSFLLLEEAERADLLASALAASLKRLAELPGNLDIDRDSVYAAITAPLPVDEERRMHEVEVHTDARRLQDVIRAWTRLPHSERTSMTPRVVTRLRALAQRVTATGRHGPQEDAAAAVLRDAAAAVETAAQRIRNDEVHAGIAAGEALGHVADLVAADHAPTPVRRMTPDA